ncbi:hypothetical protein CABS01_05768 [Colletotrichum abscissum]|nr:uncharacterized protein CABS01_05768 [Colletotrichum abscissum]KAK1521263.1 hypothetical protein CABS01_05768 [Colletotrichum abscissum]
MNMTRSTASREGQPVVAVNPTKPDNIVFVSTRFHPLPELEPVGCCFLTYTLDCGITWKNATADYPSGAAQKCGEPQVFADANGTFYLLNNQVFSGLRENIAAHPQLCEEAADRRGYGKGIPDPPPIYGFPGRSIAVHDSILASAAEGSKGHPEMYVRHDKGVTWETFPLIDSRGTFVANGTGPMLAKSGIGLRSDPTPWVSADPTSTGRFALMVPRDFTLEIYITHTAGGTFTDPAVIQTPDAQRPAFDFSPNGLPGVVWRTNSSCILDVYLTLSFDGGRNFAVPIKVTAQPQPQPVGQNGQPGGRASFISLTHNHTYVAWSDGRDGLLDAVLAEIPLDLLQTMPQATEVSRSIRSRGGLEPARM